jgi:hypothetical protein
MHETQVKQTEGIFLCPCCFFAPLIFVLTSRSAVALNWTSEWGDEYNGAAGKLPDLTTRDTLPSDSLGLYQSTNGGATWTQVNDTQHQGWGGVKCITGDMRPSEPCTSEPTVAASSGPRSGSNEAWSPLQSGGHLLLGC